MGIPKKIYGYLRAKGKGQTQTADLDRQLQTITFFCNAGGYSLERIFTEQDSGTKAKEAHTQFSAMVSALFTNGVDRVVVDTPDRFSREHPIREQLLIYLAAREIRVFRADTGEEVTRTMAGDRVKRAMIGNQRALVELDRKLAGKKPAKGRRGHRTGTREHRILVSRIKRLRWDRKGVKRMTYQQVADALNEKGVTTADGKAFTPYNVAAILYRDRKRKTKNRR